MEAPVFRNHFALETVWHLDTTLEEIRGLFEDLLRNPGSLPRLWPHAFLECRVLEPGDARALQRVMRLQTRGFLPYRLRWQVRLCEIRDLERYAFDTCGDLTGRAVFTVAATTRGVSVALDWRLTVRKPLLRSVAWLLKPLLAANHRWAMARGRETVQREIHRRRRAVSAAA
jgi:hypothetical protein